MSSYEERTPSVELYMESNFSENAVCKVDDAILSLGSGKLYFLYRTVGAVSLKAASSASLVENIKSSPIGANDSPTRATTRQRLFVIMELQRSK
ncbi:MAG: hypothetical protein LUG45_04865 [Clostridiales bacterium]|nr:hypothetical protein [Clostridiales bacterium]